MGEFATQPLSDFCPPDRTISYGIVQPGVHHAGGVPIVRVNNFENNKLRIIETLSVHPDIEAKYARSRPKAGDVLITLVGSIGQIAIASDEIEGWNLARAVGLIPTRNIEDAKWIYFALQAPEAQQYMLQRANTTVQTTFNLGDLTKLPIPLPHLSERQAILKVLSTLDDKIELNRRTNETLEAMAQAIFRDWFVDFGPVRRKMQGETNPTAILGGLIDTPTKAAELAALFPDALGDNGLPEGWKTSDLYEYADVIYGAPFASKHFNINGVGRPLARIRDLPKNQGGQFTLEQHRKEFTIQPGSIVVGMDGEFRAYVWQGKPTLMNQRICCFEPIERSNRAFVWLGVQRDLAFYESSAIATTVIHLGKKDIDRFELVAPGKYPLAAFAEFAEPLLDRIVLNGLENRTLAETRDYLLPKLMSGEIRCGAS